jgi:predicted ribosomally synthesized peptide with SipW-like signal peptide
MTLLIIVYDNMSSPPPSRLPSDEEMGIENIHPAIHSPSHQDGRDLPRSYSRRIAPDAPAYSTSSQSVPVGLKKWYSNEIFRVVTFFILMSAVLGVTTVAWFSDRLSSDQMLGVISTLLMMAMPSALQGKSKKKVYYVNDRPS